MLKPDQVLVWSRTVEKEVSLPDEVAATRRKLILLKEFDNSLSVQMSI